MAISPARGEPRQVSLRDVRTKLPRTFAPLSQAANRGQAYATNHQPLTPDGAA